ncbi:hypothetical protein YC2023_049281 [Brassica napus]
MRPIAGRILRDSKTNNNLTKKSVLTVEDNTGVFPMSYDPTDKNDDFLDPEGEFCSYLDDLASSSDVQDYIKEHSFGQPMIDSSHPDWSFYSKVIKDYYLAYVC